MFKNLLDTSDILYRNLILPMFLLCIPELLWDIFWDIKDGTFEVSYPFVRIINIVLGFQGQGKYGGGLGTLWFVYTLVIIKVIMHYVRLTSLRYVILFLLLSISFFLNYIGFEVYNAWVNVCLAFPFYLVGIELKKIKLLLDRGTNVILMLILFILCVVVISLCGEYNGLVLMYNNGYGQNFFLFLIGAFLGTFALYILCWFLRSYDSYLLRVLSVGNIITLGLHYIVRIIYQNIPLFSKPSYWEYLCAFITLITFIPIIIISKRYLPFLLGKSRANNI